MQTKIGAQMKGCRTKEVRKMSSPIGSVTNGVVVELTLSSTTGLGKARARNSAAAKSAE